MNPFTYLYFNKWIVVFQVHSKKCNLSIEKYNSLTDLIRVYD